MAMVGLLAAFRARVTARGMTFTALAHASGVQPGNLRRMFTSTTGSPRLGSVMRLLAPLHARIAPAGARTAAELTAFLDGLRRRSALDWEQVLGVTGPYAGKVAARLESDPEQLSLDVVIRIAEALHIYSEIPVATRDLELDLRPGRFPYLAAKAEGLKITGVRLVLVAATSQQVDDVQLPHQQERSGRYYGATQTPT